MRTDFALVSHVVVAAETRDVDSDVDGDDPLAGTRVVLPLRLRLVDQLPHPTHTAVLARVHHVTPQCSRIGRYFALSHEIVAGGVA